MRPSLLNPLFVSVESFKGIGPKLSAWIQQLCGPKVVDVLWHLPTALHHRPVIQKAPDAPTLATLQMTVTKHQIPHHKKQPCIVFGTWADGDIQLVFFNYHASFLTQKLAVG